ETWIARAERLIRATFPNIQGRIDSGDEPDLQDNVIDVVVAMVPRVFRNPNGYRSMTGPMTAGPFAGSDTVTCGGASPGARARTGDEKALLLGEPADRGDAGSGVLLACHQGADRGADDWGTIGWGSEW